MAKSRKDMEAELRKTKSELNDIASKKDIRTEEKEGRAESLRTELERVKQEYEDLEVQHQKKITEAQRLKSRLDERDGDFEDEIQSMQEVSLQYISSYKLRD
jgi:predicted nuclease with TOPRIM domain